MKTYVLRRLIALVPVALVVATVGFVLIQTAIEPKQLAPLTVSKINTLVQIALVGFVLAREGFGLAAEPTTGLLIAAAAATTAAPAPGRPRTVASTPRSTTVPASAPRFPRRLTDDAA